MLRMLASDCSTSGLSERGFKYECCKKGIQSKKSRDFESSRSLGGVKYDRCGVACAKQDY